MAVIDYGGRDNMNNIERYDISEEWAHSGIIKAGDWENNDRYIL